jgi:predicted ATP-binding protein involved in virulence
MYFNKFTVENHKSCFESGDERRLPISIKQFQIKNYQGIIKTWIKGIPLDTQWIFLTGENGFGKTCVLQAIVIGLFGNRDNQEILTDDNCNISVELKAEGENRIYRMGIPKFEDFAAYGPSRLNHQAQESQNEISRKSSPTYSLFHTDGILLNIEYNLVIWHLKKDPRYEIITQALLNILPYITEITIADEQVFYTESETEESGKTYQPMPFEKLASGHRSIIAMIGDMLIRFFKQQPDVRRTEDFKGIVFIDELDSHLHPKWQRELPALLSAVFPNVQFVASTHSVIPFLGAPENSVFLKVTRNREQGIQIEKVDIDIRNLLPNTLLTSPLFDMERLSQRNNKNLAEVRTEDSYDEMTKNDEIRARLKAFEDSDMDFPDALFETGE